MKKIILTTITVLTTTVLFAQEDNPFGFNTGDFIISGAINFTDSESTSVFINSNDQTRSENIFKSRNLSIIPEIGYFLNKSLMIGASYGYLESVNESVIGGSRNKGTGYVIGLNLRYYFTPFKRFSFFADLKGSQSKKDGEIRSSNYPSLYENKQIGVALSPGINVFITKNLAVMSKIGSIGYFTSESKSYSPLDNQWSQGEQHEFKASLDSSNLFFGVLYKF